MYIYPLYTLNIQNGPYTFHCKLSFSQLAKSDPPPAGGDQADSSPPPRETHLTKLNELGDFCIKRVKNDAPLRPSQQDEKNPRLLKL